MVEPGRILLAAALCAALVAASGTGARGDVLISEDFDDLTTPGLVIASQHPSACAGREAVPAVGNAACVDDVGLLSGGLGTGRLVLTHEFTDQIGYAWFQPSFDLSSDRISVGFDLYVRADPRRSPDGVSLVFQLGDDATLVGKPGASLGTGDLPAYSIAVAFDLRDSGEHDPESPCDDTSTRTCHVEVNQDSDPKTEPSLLVSTSVPDIVGAGSLDQPIRVEVVMNGREIAVSLDAAYGAYGARQVIHALLEDYPLGPAILGFVGTTGGGAAVEAVDNLTVTREPVDPPVIEWEPAVEAGGVNCGGPAVDAVVGGESLELSADSTYGEVLSIEPGTPTRFVLRPYGRVPTGSEDTAVYDRPVAGLPDPSLEAAFQTEVSSPRDLTYIQRVVSGRYAVVLFWAESCHCAVDLSGRSLRRLDVELGGVPVLRFFDPAEAAGRDLGQCGPAFSTAVTRSFQLDVPGASGEDGVLEVRVRDLGGGAPPLDAALNGFYFKRLGSASGEPASGDLEDHRRPSLARTDDFREVFNLDFEPAAQGGLDPLSGVATVNPGRFFTPAVVDGRLRLADDGRMISGTSVVFDMGGALVIDPLSVVLRAGFDVFVANPDGKIPAEGIVFAIVGTDAPDIAGGPGGDLGLTGIGYPAIGVEVDLWQGGGFGDDSGYNTDGQAHVAVVGSGASLANVDHVQDQNDYDPALDARSGGWLDWLSPAGVRMEVLYSPEAHVQVYVTANDGSFPRRKVLDTFVSPFEVRKALVGFFAATGSETATIEVDDFLLEVADCIDQPEVARILGDSTRTVAVPPGESATASFDGSASTGGEGEAGEPFQPLEYRWTISGPFGGAIVEGPCKPLTDVTFSVPGLYKLTLEVDDRHCTLGPESSATVTIVVKEAGEGPQFVRGDNNGDGGLDISDPVSTLNALFLGRGEIACEDSADSNDDGKLDISDPVSTLIFLFMGGAPPEPPYPACGSDGTDDAQGCLTVPPACA